MRRILLADRSLQDVSQAPPGTVSENVHPPPFSQAQLVNISLKGRDFFLSLPGFGFILLPLGRSHAVIVPEEVLSRCQPGSEAG